MSETETAAKFLLAGGLATELAIDRIACWDEFTVPGDGWNALDVALTLEEAKRRPRAAVVAALVRAMRFAGDGSHPANLMRPMALPQMGVLA